MAQKNTTTIEVDAQAAEILHRASARARANGETLGSYLRHALPSETGANASTAASRQAWKSFVAGMTQWAEVHLPKSYVADDSRDAMYGDRT